MQTIHKDRQPASKWKEFTSRIINGGQRKGFDERYWPRIVRIIQVPCNLEMTDEEPLHEKFDDATEELIEMLSHRNCFMARKRVKP